MKITTLTAGLIKTNCYLVQEGNTAILVDAEVGLERVLQHTNKLDAILLTHGHFDHIKNLAIIAQHFKCPVYLHQNAIEKLSDPFKNCSKRFKGCVTVDSLNLDLRTLQDRQILNMGDLKGIEVFYTPGHTVCSVSFKIGENLFSGDTLFVGAVGRTDLWDSSADDMKKSLKTLENLDWNNLYPGHGSTMENIKNF